MQEIRLPYFTIDGHFGGSQSWMLDPQMRLGGCAALTACDLCIQLSLFHGDTMLFPFFGQSLDKSLYRKFSAVMKPYLHPRMTGVDTLQLFLDGFGRHLQTIPQPTTSPGPFLWRQARPRSERSRSGPVKKRVSPSLPATQSQKQKVVGFCVALVFAGGLPGGTGTVPGIGRHLRGRRLAGFVAAVGHRFFTQRRTDFGGQPLRKKQNFSFLRKSTHLFLRFVQKAEKFTKIPSFFPYTFQKDLAII